MNGEQGPNALSSREREVLELIGRGATNRQIADELFIGRETVKSHLSSMFRTLGVTNRYEAQAWVQRTGWRGGNEMP